MNIDIETIKRAAESELDQERLRLAIDKYKEKLKKKKWWHKLLPFKIIITRRD